MDRNKSELNEKAIIRNLELVDLYVEDITEYQNLSKSTIRAYVPDAKRAAQIFGEMGVTFDQIDVPDLKKFMKTVEEMSSRRGGLTSGRLKGIFSQLNSIMEFLVYNNYAQTNKVPGFRKRYLKSYKNSVSESTEKQVPPDSHLSEMIYSIPDIQKRAYHLLLAKTGLRREESILLNIEDVDLVEQSITTSRFRKRTNRRLPIDKECASALELYFRSMPTYPRVEGEKSLFVNREGRRIGKNTVSRWINQEAQRCGFHDPSADRLDRHKKFGPHNYRHWFTTALRRNDCPERIIKHLRGDADNSTADRYDHVTWGEVVEAYTACIPALIGT